MRVDGTRHNKMLSAAKKKKKKKNISSLVGAVNVLRKEGVTVRKTDITQQPATVVGKLLPSSSLSSSSSEQEKKRTPR